MMLRKLGIWAAIMVLLWALLPSWTWAAEEKSAVKVSAKAALLLDAQTGQVLWQKDGYEQLPPASTTKILTALLCLDIAPLDRVAEATAQAAAVGESSAGLLAGERFAMGELLDAALLKSANDACFALAEGAVGSEPFFVRLMNLKAAVLGAAGARLLNTNGLPAEGHSMSCYDLALLARVAMQNPEFATRVGSVYGVMEGGSYNRKLKNTNKLLQMDEHITGIKTGTTDAAGACLVSAMERDGRSLIAVVLHSGDRYGDSLRLLNWGVDGFANCCAVRQGQVLGAWSTADGAEIAVRAATDLWLTLPVDNGAPQAELRTEFAWCKLPKLTPIKVGDVLGTVYFYGDEEYLGRVNLLAAAEYQPSRWQMFWGRLTGLGK